MTGIALIQEIDRLKAEGLGWEDLAVKLKLTTQSQKKFVRDLVLKQAERKVA